jgi:hypothetical protein
MVGAFTCNIEIHGRLHSFRIDLPVFCFIRHYKRLALQPPRTEHSLWLINIHLYSWSYNKCTVLYNSAFICSVLLWRDLYPSRLIKMIVFYWTLDYFQRLIHVFLYSVWSLYASSATSVNPNCELRMTSTTEKWPLIVVVYSKLHLWLMNYVMYFFEWFSFHQIWKRLLR